MSNTDSTNSVASQETVLLPCPFCGGKAEFKNELGWSDDEPENWERENDRIVWGVFVKCSECCCIFGQGHMNSQECYEGIYGTLEEAASAWNHRFACP